MTDRLNVAVLPTLKIVDKLIILCFFSILFRFLFFVFLFTGKVSDEIVQGLSTGRGDMK